VPLDGTITDFQPVVAEPMPPEGLVLLRAARIVREGWCKGALKRGDSVCALGAIRRACGLGASDVDNTSPLKSVAYKMLREQIGGSIADFNNAPERTAEEVATAMEAAAYATVEG